MLLDERPFSFDEPGWIYEIKFDGWRLMAEFGDGKCLRTRNGANATTWFPEVTHALKGIEGGPYVVDDEICVLDATWAGATLTGSKTARGAVGGIQGPMR